MGLLDKELISVKSEYTKKPEWALCKFCRVPFLTSTFSNTCERCSHYVQYQIEYNSKIMLAFIILTIINNLIVICTLMFISKYVRNFNLNLLITTLVSVVQGYILWKIVKQIMSR